MTINKKIFSSRWLAASLALMLTASLSSCGLISITAAPTTASEAATETTATVEAAPVFFHNEPEPPSASVEAEAATVAVETPPDALPEEVEVASLEPADELPESMDSSSQVQELLELDNAPLFIPGTPAVPSLPSSGALEATAVAETASITPPAETASLVDQAAETLTTASASADLTSVAAGSTSAVAPAIDPTASLPVIPIADSVPTLTDADAETTVEADDTPLATPELGVTEPVVPDATLPNAAAAVVITPDPVDADNNADADSAEEAADPPAPAPSVENSAPEPDDSEANTHTVSPGETLYRIARRYDVDLQQLAERNNIAAPGYLIYPGMQLQLRAQPEAPTPPARSTHTVQSGDTMFSIARRYQMSVPELAELNSIAAPAYLIYPGMELTVNASEEPASAAPEPEKPAEPQEQPAATVLEAESSWLWPLRGATRPSGRKEMPGIVISAEANAVVRATRAGTVALANDDFRAIGLVVFIQHEDEYISAYGYQQDVLVQPGESVAAGQSLGRLDGRGELYFEIRRAGEALAPASLLGPQ